MWGLKPSSGAEKAALVFSEDYRAKPEDSDNYFEFFGKRVNGIDLNFLTLIPKRSTTTAPEYDLFLHDPKFWQMPRVWWRFFKARNGNSSTRAFASYMYDGILWKLDGLIRLTLGIWSESAIEQFQIRFRAATLNLSLERQEEHEAMLRAVGQQQSIVW
jgi:hypothetical protein